jgi:hypothetical protein
VDLTCEVIVVCYLLNNDILCNCHVIFQKKLPNKKDEYFQRCITI